MASMLIQLSSSLSTILVDKKDPVGSHFRWSSIKKFLYLGFASSIPVHNFDMFSNAHTASVRIYEYIVMAITIGMSYMFMDCFINQYTKRTDAIKLMNPLLKGVIYGLFLQTGFMTVQHAKYSAESLQFYLLTFEMTPAWARCPTEINHKCIQTAELVFRCNYQLNFSYPFTKTSAHYYYRKSFENDKNSLNKKYFVVGVVWIVNFFLSSVTDESLSKIFKLAFAIRALSPFVVLIFLILLPGYNTSAAFYEILKWNSNTTYIKSMYHVGNAYGVGYLNLHDFSSMSPYMMVDNSVVIYGMIFTLLAFIRSWITRIIIQKMEACVPRIGEQNPHYFFYSVVPYSTEFMHPHRLYSLYIYVNLLVSAVCYLTISTATMSKILSYEFRSIKYIYIVGILCCFGFGLTIFMISTLAKGLRGVTAAVNGAALLMGGYKVAIIMWVYGVKRFSKDIHYWLGFKPTKFWIVSWTVLPIILSGSAIVNAYIVMQSKNPKRHFIHNAWIIFSVLVVISFQIKTIVNYVLLNNIVGVFGASNRYGPPEYEDKKRRQVFDEILQSRQCTHNCNALDDMFDCNHLPLMQSIQKSMSRTSLDQADLTPGTPSLTNIFVAGSTRRPSSLLETESNQ